MHLRKFTSVGSALAFKLKADVTKSPRRGYRLPPQKGHQFKKKKKIFKIKPASYSDLFHITTVLLGSPFTHPKNYFFNTDDLIYNIFIFRF